MAISDTVILVGAFTGLLTACTLFGGFVLSLLTFLRQGRRDAALHAIGVSIDGMSEEMKASARGQAPAEATTAGLEGEKRGIASERADHMSSAGS
jgi:hypothetical protein